MQDEEILLHLPGDSGSETVCAEHVNGDNYRVLENPIFFCNINVGTTVKALPDEKGDLIIKEIISPSQYITRRFLLDAGPDNAKLNEKIRDKIIEAGGHWEVVFRGMAIVDIPKDAGFDLDRLFAELNYYPHEIKEGQA